MAQTRTELKADLRVQADLMIDELLDWNEQTGEPTLTQIEEVVLQLRKRLGEQMAQAVIQSQEAQRPVPGPACPECQCEMHYKGQRRHTVESRVGSLTVERGYYYCETCGRSVFPPG
jgi:uncharacterized protein with PIN domain